jgi:hypothetical protein
MSTTEELLGRESGDSCLENREYCRRNPSRWPRGILYPQKLALTSLTSGGRLVGIVTSRAQATEFSLVVGPWPIFQFHNPIHGRNPWTGDQSFALIIIGLIIVLTIIQWWRDIVREGTYQGLHTKVVTKGLTWGIILFIISEVFFFISFFWAFFHRSLSPTIVLGSTGPPTGTLPFNPLQIPLLNTAILLASGVTVTWTHHGLLENNYTQGLQGFFFTVTLWIYFTILQAYEYIARFNT